jgi:hypothetical protein
VAVPLSGGAKIAIGCGVAFLAGVIALAAVGFGLAWWGYGKAKQVAQDIGGDVQRIEAARAKANANPFTPPADGVIQEERLVKFLAVRRKLYGVYAKYKDVIEAQDKTGKDPDLKFMGQAFAAINELRTVTAEGLAEQGMSEDEYRYLATAVYKTMLGGGIAPGGKSITDLAQTAADAAAQQAQQALEQAEANPDLPESAKQQLRDAARQARAQADQAAEAMQGMEVPPQNIALFRKHQDEIQQYAMSGLELLGL